MSPGKTLAVEVVWQCSLAGDNRDELVMKLPAWDAKLPMRIVLAVVDQTTREWRAYSPVAGVATGRSVTLRGAMEQVEAFLGVRPIELPL